MSETTAETHSLFPKIFAGIMVVVFVGVCLYVLVLVGSWIANQLAKLPPAISAYNAAKFSDCVARGGTVTEGPLYGVYCVGLKKR